jgi:hypothetical protein
MRIINVQMQVFGAEIFHKKDATARVVGAQCAKESVPDAQRQKQVAVCFDAALRKINQTIPLSHAVCIAGDVYDGEVTHSRGQGCCRVRLRCVGRIPAPAQRSMHIDGVLQKNTPPTAPPSGE